MIAGERGTSPSGIGRIGKSAVWPTGLRTDSAAPATVGWELLPDLENTKRSQEVIYFQIRVYRLRRWAPGLGGTPGRELSNKCRVTLPEFGPRGPKLARGGDRGLALSRRLPLRWSGRLSLSTEVAGQRAAGLWNHRCRLVGVPALLFRAVDCGDDVVVRQSRLHASVLVHQSAGVR